MNLLCPNCQNPVTVDEQFAGQLMKCPLCNQNFSVPTLPASGGVHDTAPHPGHEAEVYGVQTEAHAPVPPPTPAVTASPPPAPPSTSLPTGPTPAPAVSAPPPPPRDGYRRTFTVTLSPRVLPWVAAGAAVLVFLLSFFPWVGYYPGGHGVLTQSAWGAAFGDYTVDTLWSKVVKWDERASDEKPGVSTWLIFFVLLMLLVVPLTVAVAALPHARGRFKVPPVVEQLEPWRWALAAGLLGLLLLFVLLQMLSGFSLESRTRAAVARSFEAKAKSPDVDERRVVIEEEEALARFAIHRTIYLRLTVLLLIVAVFAAAAMHWLLQRGEARPLPRADLMW